MKYSKLLKTTPKQREREREREREDGTLQKSIRKKATENFNKNCEVLYLYVLLSKCEIKCERQLATSWAIKNKQQGKYKQVVHLNYSAHYNDTHSLSI